MKRNDEGPPGPRDRGRPGKSGTPKKPNTSQHFIRQTQPKGNRGVAQFLLVDVATIRIAGIAAPIGGAR